MQTRRVVCVGPSGQLRLAAERGHPRNSHLANQALPSLTNDPFYSLPDLDSMIGLAFRATECYARKAAIRGDPGREADRYSLRLFPDRNLNRFHFDLPTPE